MLYLKTEKKFTYVASIIRVQTLLQFQKLLIAINKAITSLINRKTNGIIVETSS